MQNRTSNYPRPPATFARGLAQDQDEYGVYLIGGDTNSTPGPLSIAIMAFGEVTTDRIHVWERPTSDATFPEQRGD